MSRLLFGSLLLFSLTSGSAFATTTAPVGGTALLEGGRTTVVLSEGFVNALPTLGVTPAAIAPARLNPHSGRVKFPIPTGAIDLASLKGDIFHRGGLELAVPGVKVSLLNFIIDTTGKKPVLTGIAAVNGEVVDRLRLFYLELTEAPAVADSTLKIRKVTVKLTKTAAETLNAVFSVEAFTPGFVVGEAYVRAHIDDIIDGYEADEASEDAL